MSGSFNNATWHYTTDEVQAEQSPFLCAFPAARLVGNGKPSHGGVDGAARSR